jgi:hypothetical protein
MKSPHPSLIPEGEGTRESIGCYFAPSPYGRGLGVRVSVKMVKIKEK